MPLSLRRSYLAGSVSALVLSATFAWAQETSTDPALRDETLVEGAAPGAVVVDPDRIGNAHEALAGMSVGDIQGMEVFDSSGERIGTVEMVAENERGGVFAIVVAQAGNNWIAEGQHAIPLISFDFNQDANGLVLRDDMAPMSTPGMGTAGDPAGWGPEGTRVFSVLDTGETIEQVDLEAYQSAEMQGGVADEETDLTDVSDERVIGDSRQILQGENITDLEGVDILSSTGEDIASVEAVAYDDQGRVYLIASFGGFLDIGDEYRAVPMESFNYSLDEEAFVFTEGGEQTLESLPVWDYDQPGYTVVESDLDWSAFESGEFAQGEDRATTGEPAPDSGQAMTDAGETAVTAADGMVGNARDVLEQQGVYALEGMDILDPDRDDIGTVENVAQDGSGRLQLIVSLDDGVLGIGDSERVVGIEAFDYLPEEDALVLRDVSEASLEAMPEWDSEDPQYTLIESDLDWATVANTETGMATDQPMVGEAVDQTEQATEQAMAEGEDALDTAGEATEQAVTEPVDETAAQVETAAGAEQDAPQTDQPAAAATEQDVGNARQMLQELGVLQLEGLDILNAEGDDIGTVNEVAHDSEGRMFLVVSLDDGILGMGESERVVALDAFDYLPEEEALYLRDISEEALEAMAEWDEDSGTYVIVDEDIDWSLYN